MPPSAIRFFSAVSFSSPGHSSCFTILQDGLRRDDAAITDGAMNTPDAYG